MAFTFGIKALKSGEVGLTGGMGNTLTTHDETLSGTAALDSTEETINWISTEESGRRLGIPQNDSETTLTFQVADPSLETMAHYLGGEVDEGTYTPPLTKESIIMSFEVETVEGYNFQIPAGRVVAKPLGGTVGRDNVMTMEVMVIAEKPTDGTTGRIIYLEKK